MGKYGLDADTQPQADDPNRFVGPLQDVRPSGSKYGHEAPAIRRAAPVEHNKVFGELKPADVTPTQRAKWAAMDALERLGVPTGTGRKLVENTFDIGSILTPAGAVSSGVDAIYHGGKTLEGGKNMWRNALHTGIDALGAIPGGNNLRTMFSDIAQFGGRRTPTIIPAHEPPPWARTGPDGRPYPPQSVAGTPHEQQGWVVPSNVELSGRGAAPFNAAAPNAYPRGSAQQGYDRIANSPVSYVPAAADDIYRMATHHITQPAINGRAAGYSAQKAPEVHDTLAQWRAYIQQRGTPITPQDLDTLRQSLRGLPDANGPAGEHAVTILDRYMVMAPSSRRASGTAQDVADMRDNFVQARGDYRGGETSRAVEERIDRAGTRQGATYSGMNENATRGEMAGLVSDQGRASKIPGATDAEATEIWQASQGTKEGNAKRMTSNLLGGGGGMHGAFTLGGTGGLVAAPLIAAGVDPWTASALGFGGGLAARTYGKNLKYGNIERTVQAAEDAASGIRQNTPLYRENLAAAEARGMGEMADPRSQMLDRITMALMPGARDTANAWVDDLYTPPEYKGEGNPLRLTVRP